MSLETLVASVGEALNVQDLRLNENKVCEFTVDERLTISIEASALEDAAHFYVLVTRAPDTGRAEFYAQLLEAQLYNRELGEGIAFGLDQETGEISLNRKLSLANVEDDSFLAALNEFVNWADYWQQKLADPNASVAQPVSDESVFSSGRFIRA
jgi:hypothetical protein